MESSERTDRHFFKDDYDSSAKKDLQEVQSWDTSSEDQAKGKRIGKEKPRADLKVCRENKQDLVI